MSDITLYDYGIEKPDDSPVLKEAIENIKAEANFWDNMFNIETPEAETYTRQGPTDKNTGEPVILEYVKDRYTIRMLNKLFPGWYTEDMKLEYHNPVNTWVCTGYLVIRYPTPEGLKTRKIWAVGATEVQVKKTIQDNLIKPSQPEDQAKGAYTEWIKLVGKRLGIGTDIFEQTISETLMQTYKDKVKDWDYTDITDKVVEGINSKKVFISYVDNLPDAKQTLDFKEIMEKVPEDKKAAVWNQFQRYNKLTVQKLINDLKQKLGV